MAHRSETDIPDQSGRPAFVTGATGGLGLRVATVLAEKGARVLLAARNPQRGAHALRAREVMNWALLELVEEQTMVAAPRA